MREVDLAAVLGPGYEGQWVRLCEAKDLTWPQMRKLQVRLIEAGDDFGARVEAFITTFVSSWRVLDGTGAPLPTPGEDPAGLERAPAQVVAILPGPIIELARPLVDAMAAAAKAAEKGGDD